MKLLKQSTARYILLGPFVDATDGVTEETGLAGSMTVYVSKDGAAQAARNSATSITYDARGYYRVHLDATDTNTLGVLRLLVHASATHLPVWADFTVVPAMIYDTLVSGTDYMDSQVKAIDTDAISAAALAAGAVTEIQSGLATQASVDTIDDFLDTEIAAIKAKTDLLPSASAGASGGLIIGSGTGTLTIDSGGNAYADARKWLGTAIETPDTAGYPKVTIKNGSGTGEVILSSGIVRAVDNSGANLASASNLATAQTSLNTIAGYIDTEVAAIKAKTDLLPSSPANEGTLTVIASYIDTEIGAIQTSISSLATTTQLGDSSATLLTGINDLKATGSALLSTTGAILADTGTDGVVVAAGSKTGYSLSASGLDSISVADPGAPSNWTTLPKIINGVLRFFWKKTQKDATTIKAYADDGTTVNATMTHSTSGSTETKGPAT